MYRTLIVMVCAAMTLAAGCGRLPATGNPSATATERIPTVVVDVAPSPTPTTAPVIQATSIVSERPTQLPTLVSTLASEAVTVTPIATSIVNTSSPAPTPVAGLSITGLKYKLIERFGKVGATPGVFYCDPDMYPVARSIGSDQVLKWFGSIDKSDEEYPAVLQRLQLQVGVDLSADQRLLVYQEYKQLRAITLAPAGDGYSFSLRISQGKTAPGIAIDGAITRQGTITILTQQPARLTCPICLALGTRIDTPSGPIRVENIVPGTIVWTVTRTGLRIAVPVVMVARTPVPVGHQVVRLQLNDDRTLRASAGHPTTDGRTLGSLTAGDTLDGARVASATLELYVASETYDLLPAGATGFYWADGILIGSTLTP